MSKTMRRTVGSLSVGLAVLLLVLLVPGIARGEMKVGAAKRVLTPAKLMPLCGGVGPSDPATSRRGDLFARAMVFEKDGTRVAIVGLDFLGFPAVLGNRVREKIRRVPAAGVLIGSTHNHSGPDLYGFPDGKGGHGGDPAYTEWVIGRIAEAVDEAAERAQPAALRINVGEARGKIAYNYYAPQLYDPRCGVIQAIATDGSGKGVDEGDVIATLVNYACHPEVLGAGSGILSPDFCGPLYDRIEEVTGGMALFMNGALGGMVTADVRGPNGRDVQTWDECVRIGTLLADEALRLAREAPVQRDPTLSCTTKTVEFPVTSPLMVALLTLSGLDYKSVTDGRSVRTVLALVNVGSAKLLTIPGEALPNIGYYLKRNMPGDHDFLLGLTNDAFGYILTRVDFDSFERYRYISRTSLGEKTGEIYMEKALDLVRRSSPADTPPAR